MVLGSSPVPVTYTSDIGPAWRKEFLDIQATMEWGFTLKRVRDMTRIYCQMHCRDKYPQHSSIIRSVWPNGWVFFYELSGSGFESSCSHLRDNLSVLFQFAALYLYVFHFSGTRVISIIQFIQPMIKKKLSS